MFLRQKGLISDLWEAEQSEQIRLFTRLLAIVFFVIVVSLALFGTLFVDSPLRLTLAIAAVALTALAWLLAKMKRLVITRVLIIGGYWLLATLTILDSGGLASPWLMSQIVVVVLAGMAIGVGPALLLAALSIGLDISLFLFPDPNSTSSGATGVPGEYLAVALISYLAVGAIIYFVNDLVKRTIDRARKNELRYRSLFDKTNDAVFLISLDNRLLKINEQGAHMLGYEPEEMVGMHIDQVIAPEEREQAHLVAARLGDQETLPVYERTMVRKDGSRIASEVDVAMITDQEGKPLHIQSVVRDISDRRRLEQQLRDNLAEMEDIAMQDPLTGLLNRRAITDHVEAEWHRARREERPMCLLLIDLDNLKQINDLYGHSTGDKALLQLAAALRKSKRRYDWMGRWGGDEFLMVLPNTNLMQASSVAERCRSIIEQEPLTDPEGERVEVRASIGLACYSGREMEDDSMDTLLAQADQALYMAKEGGRNKIAIYRD